MKTNALKALSEQQQDLTLTFQQMALLIDDFEFTPRSTTFLVSDLVAGKRRMVENAKCWSKSNLPLFERVFKNTPITIDMFYAELFYIVMWF